MAPRRASRRDWEAWCKARGCTVLIEDDEDCNHIGYVIRVCPRCGRKWDLWFDPDVWDEEIVGQWQEQCEAMDCGCEYP